MVIEIQSGILSKLLSAHRIWLSEAVEGGGGGKKGDYCILHWKIMIRKTPDEQGELLTRSVVTMTGKSD